MKEALILTGRIPEEHLNKETIGIGCTSYNRPKHWELWKSQIEKYLPKYNIIVHCAFDTDEDRKGIAFRKNECLRALKDCDFVALMDDDVFPISEGWIDFFISAHKSSGQHHFNYMRPTPTHKVIGEENGIEVWNECSGCFMFMTKECIDRVGAFDERGGMYGHEHGNYTKRIHIEGLTPMGKYLCPKGASEYLYALDLQSNLSFNKSVGHKSSLKPKEALECIAKGQEHYNKVITEIYLPL